MLIEVLLVLVNINLIVIGTLLFIHVRSKGKAASLAADSEGNIEDINGGDREHESIDKLRDRFTARVIEYARPRVHWFARPFVGRVTFAMIEARYRQAKNDGRDLLHILKSLGLRESAKLAEDIKSYEDVLVRLLD